MYLEPCCIGKELPKLLKEHTFKDKAGKREMRFVSNQGETGRLQI